MATHKPFRELLPPGTNFEFVGKTRMWVTISLVLVIASIAMLFVNKSVRGNYLNWTIDFKGGTEIIFEFKGDKKIGPGDVRTALKAAGEESVEVSDYAWTEDGPDGGETTANGLRIRSPKFSAATEKERSEYSAQFEQKYKDSHGLLKVNWSGDTMHVRTTKPMAHADGVAFFEGVGRKIEDWPAEDAKNYATPQEGTGEFNAQFRIHGVDRQYQAMLANAFSGTDVEIVQVYGVGAKAGAQLRNDGIKSLFYALILIMLYLVFRFDVRYAPGAAIALLHDGIIVIGAYAVTWTDFSLTSVAALLTVIGYSVNDSVVIFDRIRENVSRLKDKKLPRIVNISLNETMSRTLLTSLTLFVVTIMMNIFGTGLVRNFAFAMNVGVVVGVYSSIFVASPVMLYLHNKYFAAPATPAK